MPAISAQASEMQITKMPPTAQETTAAGPATAAAFRLPNSQPEPMIAPMERKSSDWKGTVRRRCRSEASKLADATGVTSAGVELAPCSLMPGHLPTLRTVDPGPNLRRARRNGEGPAEPSRASPGPRSRGGRAAASRPAGTAGRPNRLTSRIEAAAALAMGSPPASVAPHGARRVLDGLGTALPGADADRLLDVQDEDLAVAHLALLAGAGGAGDHVDHPLHDLVPHHRLDLEPRSERDVDGRSPVALGVAALGPAALHLGHGHAAHAALVEDVLDLLQALVPDDRHHHLHALEASCLGTATGTFSPSGCGLTVGNSAGRYTPPGTGMKASG